MAEQRPEQETPEAKRREAREAETRPAGLIAMIPNQVLPEEGKRHLWAARREFLLAVRSLANASVGMLESVTKGRRRA